jgi:tol-pal system protein YbgF
MIRIFRTKASAAAILLLPMLMAAPAQADGTAGLRSVLDAARREAGQIRRDITQVQMSPDAALQLNRRVDALERLIQHLTDKIDTLDAHQRDFERDFERYKNDTDFHLSQLDKGGRTPNRTAPPPPGPRAPGQRTEAPPRQAEPRRDADTRTARRDAPTRTAAEPDRSRAGGSARDDYEHALQLLRRADYKRAEAALLDFIHRYPDDKLAANAYYWLGENYYAQGRYRDAAFQFADGYRKFPKHPKAQDSLFKLGMSLEHEGKTNDACATFAEYGKRFPQAGLRREAEAERQRMRCSP